MGKKYHVLFIMMLLGTVGFAQTKPVAALHPEPKAAATAKISDSVAKKPRIHERAPLPENQKIGPEIFYIVDDKAVDYSTYVKSLQNAKDKR